MPISIVILLLVLIGITFRKLSPTPIPIWILMTLGAFAVLVSGQISFTDAFKAINFEVIGYLFGVFVIGQALEESGYLSQLSYYLFRHAKNPTHLIFLVIFMSGFTSAYLMNDTLAIMMTPIILHIAQHNKIKHEPLLLGLAYSISIGSVMSPIGNPQNLLISLSGNLTHPFIQFLQHLFLPTLVCLFVAYGIVWLRYRNAYKQTKISIQAQRPHNQHLTRLTKIALLLMSLFILMKIAHTAWKIIPNLDFSLIAIISALPVLLFSNNRLQILKNMDWATIVFFISMFVLMQSVWDSGVVQQLMQSTHTNIASIPSILSISAILSQLISNVPLVALYLPVLQTHGASTIQLLALAAGSTIAGNFLIIGAASNVIIIQNAERRKKQAFSVIAFMGLGIPIGLLSLMIYWIFLSF